jgi:ABC-type glycerol-3-phosphate transport system substrate-binding protein
MLKTKNKVLAALLMIFLVAAGCGSGGAGGGGGGITLKIWGVFDTTEDLMPIFSAYQQQYRNVKIEYTMKNVEDYETDLLNAMASGTGPDIFLIHNDWLPKYKDKMVEAPEKAVTLRDYKDTFVDVASQDFVSANKVYAMPFNVDSLVLYYNKDILGTAGIPTPPKTWEELRQQVIRISQPNNTGGFKRSGVAMGTTNNINRAVDILYLLMLQNKTPAYSNDFSRATLEQSIRDGSGQVFYPALDALDYFTAYSNPSADMYTWNTKSNYSIDSFAAGELAFMYGYSFTREQIHQKAPNLNYDIISVPQRQVGQNHVNYANYWGYGVSKQSQNKDWAWSFLRSAVSKDNLKAYHERTNTPASRKDLISEQLSDPFLGIFANANLTAKSFYKRDAEKVDQIFAETIDSVVLRGKALNSAINSANQQINFLHQDR